MRWNRQFTLILLEEDIFVKAEAELELKFYFIFLYSYKNCLPRNLFQN